MLRNFRTTVARATITAVVLTGATIGLIGNSAAPASATVSQGVINSTTCYPHNATIQQQIEVYRTAGETVAVRSVLALNGRFTFSPWQFAAAGSTGRAIVSWSTVPRGEYQIWVQVGVWNPYSGSYTYFQYQVPASQLSTYGRPIGNGIFVGGVQGRCSM